MRYTLETEKNKLKKDGTGKNTCYYVRGWDGSKGVMSKDWVVKNIDNISNASLSGGKVYLVNDRFDRAKTTIFLEMLNQINKKGINIKKAYQAATAKRGLSKITKLPAKTTTNQAWDFIAHYEINKCYLDQSWIFMTLLRQVLEEVRDEGKTVWMIQVDDQVIITTKKIDRAIEVTNITQVLERLN